MNALTRWLHRMFNTRTYQNRISIELSGKVDAVVAQVIQHQNKPGGILWRVRNGIAR